MKVAVLGNARSPLTGHTVRALIDGGVPPAAILLDSREESAKDLSIWETRTQGRLPPPPLHAFASDVIPAYFVENTNTDEATKLMESIGIELAVNGGCPRILSTTVLEALPHGVLNIHPGVLPAFRGSSCVEWAIYEDKPVGNTVHFMVAGIDEGPIVACEDYRFSKRDGYEDVRTIVYRSGFALLADAVAQVAEKGMRPGDAPSQDTSAGAFYPPIPPEKMEAVVGKLRDGRYRYQR